MIITITISGHPWGLSWTGEEDGLNYDDLTDPDNLCEVQSLHVGDWFACTGPVNSDGTGGLQMWTGQVAMKCLGSILVQLDRTWDDRIWWAPETKVMKLDNPRGRRVSLTQFED